MSSSLSSGPGGELVVLQKHRASLQSLQEQLHHFLKNKQRRDDKQQNKKEEKRDEKEEKQGVEFVHRLLSNPEKLHFYALAELLRLDFRQALVQLSQSGGQDTLLEKGMDENAMEQVAALEAEITELLTTIGSLHFLPRVHHWSNWVDDSLRLLAAWLIFCWAALLFPMPFLVYKGVAKCLKRAGFTGGRDIYSPIALLFTQCICGLILRVSALNVEVSDERSDKGLALMSSHYSVTCFNHTSTIDAFVLPAVTKHFSFMLGKKELFALPFFSWLLAVFGAIPIDRKDRDSAVMSLQLAASSVSEGQTVSISPEGTRSPTGLLLPFKKGPFYLWEAMDEPQQKTAEASSTDKACLVQPVLVTGAFDLFPTTSLFSVPGVAQVRYLEPIHPSELPPSSPSFTKRDAMSVLLRRRLLEASVSPEINATATPNATFSNYANPSGARPLTKSERWQSIASLFACLGSSFFFFYKLHSYLASSWRLSNGQIAGWGSAMSIAVTAAIYTYYTLKLRRAKKAAGNISTPKKQD